jgi:hypothetical protein
MSLWKDSQAALNNMTPFSASISGTQITTGLGSAHQWAPTHNGVAVKFCKGASLLSTGTAGVLAVHLTEDPVGTWYLLDIINGEYIGAEFDLVGDSNHGTTVALDAKLYIYPGLYSNVSNTEPIIS